MQLRAKKIIAREFLAILSCILVSSIYFFGVLIYNYRLDSQIEDTTIKIQKRNNLIDSLVAPFKNKLENQEWFYDESENKVIQDRYKSSGSPDQLWERLSYLYKADSIVYKWDNIYKKNVKDGLREIGFKNGNEFNLFIKENSLSDSESEVYTRVQLIKEEITSLDTKVSDIEQNKFDHEEQIGSTLLILLIIGLVIFPLRYIVYAICWSYRILKQKE